MLSNFHTHTSYCDGKSTQREMILAAIDGGFLELGFSVHSPIGDLAWCIPKGRLPEYFSEISALKLEYRDKIKLFCGIEQDFTSDASNLPFDYIIGSVHSVETPHGERFIDLSLDGLTDIIDNHFRGDAYMLAEAYYERVGDIVLKTDCDIIGHFDIVTKFIEKRPYLSEEHPRYIAAQNRALDKLLDTNAIFEVNTGAIARGHRTVPYPNEYALLRIRESGKPVVINSDCHRKDLLSVGISETRKMLSSLSIPWVNSMCEIKSITKK